MTRQAHGDLLLLETTIVEQILPGEAGSIRPASALPSSPVALLAVSLIRR